MGTGELLGKPKTLLGVTCDGLASRPAEEEHRNRDKLHYYLSRTMLIMSMLISKCFSKCIAINEEQSRFQCKIISIANANTHCSHYLNFQVLQGLERITR